MSAYTIPDPGVLQQEIRASHERCRQYGVDPHNRCTPGQIRLSPEALERRREMNRAFLDVAVAQVRELYQFVAGAGFVVTIADGEGYIMEMVGDESTMGVLQAGNCWPGFRWTERDVGTSVISLTLERKIPVQITDEEHFCQRGYGHTCSAAPVFSDNGRLLGVIAMSGDAQQVHPHTLGMVITASKSIENQMRLLKASGELLLRNRYMNAIIESIDSGVMAVDRDGVISQINHQGKRILDWPDDLQGAPLSALLGAQVDLNRIMHAGFGVTDREIFIRGPKREIQLLITAKPIFDAGETVQGIIVVFNEIHRIRRLVNEMAGSQARFTFDDIIGDSPAIEDAKRLALLAATGRSTVLLQGETGTGKELFAQSIHNGSGRKHHPFVAINCGAIPRELLESELFGYAGGAFTGAKKGGRPGKFELASGGTVLLDEIGDMPTDMQVKLLRVLQTGEVTRIGEHKPIPVDVRVIAATHMDLKREVEKGNFREDLFYRLNVFPIVIPPLRERAEDIPLLADHILARCARSLGKSAMRFSKASKRTLTACAWPGNIRELENVVERAVNLEEGTTIEPQLMGGIGEQKDVTESRGRSRSSLAEVEKRAVQDVLEVEAFNISRAAEILGITRATLYRKISKYGLNGVARAGG